MGTDGDQACGCNTRTSTRPTAQRLVSSYTSPVLLRDVLRPCSASPQLLPLRSTRHRGGSRPGTACRSSPRGWCRCYPLKQQNREQLQPAEPEAYTCAEVSVLSQQLQKQTQPPFHQGSSTTPLPAPKPRCCLPAPFITTSQAQYQLCFILLRTEHHFPPASS